MTSKKEILKAKVEIKEQLQANAIQLVQELKLINYDDKFKMHLKPHEFYTHVELESFVRFAANLTADDLDVIDNNEMYIRLLQKKAIKDLGTHIYGDEFYEDRLRYEHKLKHNATKQKV